MSPSPALPLRLRALRIAFHGVRRVAPDLALRWAERIFCTPRRHRASEPEVAALKRGHAFQVHSHGLRLRARVWGDGPAILLLHGWEGRGSQFHAFLDPLVKAGFSAIALDQPAHGHSQGARANPAIWSQALEALVTQIGPLHGLITHSLGAAGAAITLDRGLRVPRAVFIAPPSEPDPFYGRLLSWLGFPEEEHPVAFHAFGTRIGIPWDRTRIRSIAPRLRAKLLVIHDRADRVVPWSCGSTIAAAWPAAQLITTEGLGHRRILTDPTVVERTVAFLSEETPSAFLPHHGDGPRSLEWHLFHRERR